MDEMVQSATSATNKQLGGRFEVLEVLGQGGFGQVYRCFDHETDMEVAVKRLHRLEASALLSFKKEFRSLADVRHPNLVRVGELFEWSGEWAFSLEYVPGTDFVRWVRPAGVLDAARLRAALVELVRGLHALHSLGLLHRDVKPENVRVTPDGRVVLLDFGLVSRHSRDIGSSAVGIAGTALYMAPEQARGEAIGPAADVYALGAILYEGLTGRTPFEGASIAVLFEKQTGVPMSPRAIDASTPDDLGELCMALLSAHPDRRPDTESLLGQLSGADTADSRTTPTYSDFTFRERSFVGRAAELAVLQRHAREASATGMRVVFLEGEGGIGKSALLRRFLEDLRAANPSAMVLRSRCHPTEQVGYNGFDGAVDELARRLARLTTSERDGVLPAQTPALFALFPVLTEAYGRRRPRDLPVAGSLPLERAALFRAFGELLFKLSARQPVVIAIDDLQWCDEESLLLLRSLIERRPTPNLLFLATLRPARDEPSAWRERLDDILGHPACSVLPIRGLSASDAEELATRLLAREVEQHVVADLVREASGHPLFLSELAREGLIVASADGRADLDSAILARTRALGRGALPIVELLCVAGAPLSSRVLRRAVGVRPEAFFELTAELRTHSLVRLAKRGELSINHDRIRDALVRALLPDRRRALHLALAFALEAEDNAEAARIASHYLEAAEWTRAAPWLELAAARALSLSAFERAAELYRLRLAQDDIAQGSEKARTLRMAFARALAGAGRAAESARAFLAALEGASESEATDLRLRAAEQLLHAGDVAAGVAASAAAFGAAGLSWPASSARALAQLLFHRLSLRLGGLRREGLRRDAHCAHLDTLFRFVQPLSWADLLRSGELAGRHLKRALRERDRRHVVLGLYMESILAGMTDPKAARAREVLTLADEYGAELETPDVRALGAFARGSNCVFRGDLAGALEQLIEAERVYREQCPDGAWLLANARGMLINVSIHSGQFRRGTSWASAWIDDARLRGDAFAFATYSVTSLGFVRHLMDDVPDRAAAEIDAAMEPWRTDAIGLQHYMEAIATHFALAYQGGDLAHAHWERRWPRLRGTFVMRLVFLRELLAALRAEAALHAALSTPRDQKLHAAVLASVGTLRRARTHAGAYGDLTHAQLLGATGDREHALLLAERAERTLQPVGAFQGRIATLYASVLRGGVGAEQASEDGRSWLCNEGFVRPARALSWLLPALDAHNARPV